MIAGCGVASRASNEGSRRLRGFLQSVRHYAMTFALASQFHVYFHVLNVKPGAFSVIVTSSR